MNIDASWPSPEEAEIRVLEIQTKLHRWANNDKGCRFADLFNLVCDPAFLLVGWRRVRTNRGSRSAGIDGQTARTITADERQEEFLRELRTALKEGGFRPLPVRERMIPKPGTGKHRRLGIPTVRDRVVQAALKLVLEPIFEADFHPCSFGFRPGRCAQDAVAEIHRLSSRSYEWILEGDIRACFDEIEHASLFARLRQRIGDKRVMALVKSFCKSGILAESGIQKDTTRGTPQGAILSPLLSNVALSVLDDHFAEKWQEMGSTSGARQARRRKGLATYKLIRYADDFVVAVSGTREHVEAIRADVETVLRGMGLRLSEEKTLITHIDEGFDFLGFRIQRRWNRSNGKRYVYTWPSRRSLDAVRSTVRNITRTGRDLPLRVLLYQLNAVLRGWTNYFRHGVSKSTFSYLRAFTWRRLICWIRRKHPRASWKQIRRWYLPGWWPSDGGVTLLNPAGVRVTRYRTRFNIESPWSKGLRAAPST